MLNRRTALAALAAIPFAAALPALAETKPFTPAALAAAQAKGPVLVEVTAPWCPTCRAQKPIIKSLTARPDFAKLTVLAVDFDSQKDVLRSLGAQQQSTLIVFKGSKEAGRSVGVTDPAAIEALLRKAL